MYEYTAPWYFYVNTKGLRVKVVGGGKRVEGGIQRVLEKYHIN